MRYSGNERFDAAARIIQDILVIDDAADGRSNCVRVEHCEGTTIVTIDSEKRALELLKTIVVDAVFNLRQQGAKAEADRFRADVARLYPNVRLTDMWYAAAGGRMPFADRNRARSHVREAGKELGRRTSREQETMPTA